MLKPLVRNSIFIPKALRLAGLVVFALIGPASAGSAEREETLPPALPAPYQVEGLVRLMSDRYVPHEGLGLSEPLVSIDLGNAEKAPHPGRRNFLTMTIIGSKGVALGQLVDIRKICDFLCGEDAEECHYVGLFQLDQPARTIGAPLAAIPGSAALLEFQSLMGEAPKPPAPFPADLIGKDFTPPVWSPYGKDGPELRITGWDSETRGLNLEERLRGGDTFPIEVAGCRLRRVDGLSELQCGGVALILSDEAPLLLSYPDYNIAAAELVATMKWNGSKLYLVRLGIKAQTIFGLLYQAKSGWKGLFRPRDYALLC